MDSKSSAEFQAKYQDYQTSAVTPRAFSDFLHEFLKQHRLDFKLSDMFKKTAGEGKMLRDLEGSRLMKEFESYVEAVFQKLSADRNGQSILELHGKSKMLRLISRLIRLELSREEWECVKVEFADLKSTYPDHFRFYEISEQREEAMLKNLLNVEGFRVRGAGSRTEMYRCV